MSSPSKEEIPPQSLSLEDGDDADDEPRRFLRLPSGHLLAYGGDNGNVSCLLPQDKVDSSKNNEKFVVVQRYEDAVRCIAVSDDGKRLAIGYDTGKTLIHCFDEFVCPENRSNAAETKLLAHPYVQNLEKAQESQGDNFLFSQDFSTGDSDLDSFAGPDLGAPARDMLFIPRKKSGDNGSSSKNTYMLAIASEAGMFVIDVTSKEVMDGCDHWLEEESKESHDQCGIRGLDAGIVETWDNKSNETSKTGHEIVVLASLAMDGRLCLWDFTNKKLLQREDSLCVPKKDVGEIHDADAYDRSCRPVIFCRNKNGEQKSGLIIATPGKLMPCTRFLQFDGEDRKLKVVDGLTFDKANDAENEHIQPIVTMMFCSDKLLVTSGQDGRVLVWSARHSKSDMKWEVVEKYQSESPATDLCVQHQRAGKVSLFLACSNGSLKVIDISGHHSQNVALEKSNMEGAIAKVDDIDRNDVATSKKTDAHKTSHFSDDSDDDDSLASPPKSKNVHFLDEAEENNDENFDEDKPKVTSFDHYSDDEDGDSLVDHGVVEKQSGYTNIPKPQPAFSPSSTPLDLTRRFLCWNHIGSVTLLQGDNNRNIIDINFADSAFKRPISFTDNINFIIGSVGESGGIFASDTKDEEYLDGEDIDGLEDFNMSERTKQAVLRDRKKRSKDSESSKPTGSSIFFYRFPTSRLVNRKNKDWHLVLPDGERALGVACGDDWAAAVTR